MEAGKPRQTSVFDHVGNIGLWKLNKTAFLCSRLTPAAQVLKCYDWAIAMRTAGKCVMLGAHSQLEKDVLHYLLKGAQPIVLVLARGMKKKLQPELVSEAEKERLLVVAPFDERVTRVTRETANVRNEFMLEHAAGVVIGHAMPGGSLAELLKGVKLPIEHL